MPTSVHQFWIIIIGAILALIPMLMALVTSYMKVSIVLGMLRNGLGTQQVPSASVIAAISLALTFYIMSPVIDQTLEILSRQDKSVFRSIPTLEKVGDYKVLLDPWRHFMKAHAGEREMKVFSDLSSKNADQPVTASETLDADESLRVIIPAFVMSELKGGFAMAFVVLLPFLVIDLVVSNLLIGMGMMMVSPMMISLPLKLIVFVVSDAWILLARGIVNSYGS